MQALGLQTAQGLVLTESFYWDLNDQTREFSKRFGEKFQGKVPTMVQAGVYSAILHYLKAVEATKSKDPEKVLAKMREMPTDDPVFGKGSVRADGRKLHPMYLFEVKKPAEFEGQERPLQARRDAAGRDGVPPARRERVPARQEV